MIVFNFVQLCIIDSALSFGDVGLEVDIRAGFSHALTISADMTVANIWVSGRMCLMSEPIFIIVNK